MSNTSQGVQASANTLINGTLVKPVEAVGKIGESASNVAVTAGRVAESSAKIAENVVNAAQQITEGLAKNTGEIADKSGQIASQAASVGVEATTALAGVMSLGKNVVQLANSLSDRAKNSLDEANKRRKEIERLKTEYTNATGEKKNEQEVAKKLADIEIEKKRIETEFQQKSAEENIKRQELEAKTKELQVKMENAQLVATKLLTADAKNTVIGTEFGYKDALSIVPGYKKSILNGSENYFFMVSGIVNAEDESGKILNVSFNDETGKKGYYVIKDNGYVYKLSIIPKRVMSRATIFTSARPIDLPSVAILKHANFTPKCFEGNGTINPTNDSGPAPEDKTEYKIITKIAKFSLSKGGKKKTKSKRKMKSKRKLKSKKKTRRQRNNKM
jgi:hypothetical protein